MTYKEAISREFCYCDACSLNEAYSDRWGYEYKKCERTIELEKILKTKKITKTAKLKETVKS